LDHVATPHVFGMKKRKRKMSWSIQCIRTLVYWLPASKPELHRHNQEIRTRVTQERRQASVATRFKSVSRRGSRREFQQQDKSTHKLHAHAQTHFKEKGTLRKGSTVT
jgi:hypothetical protein